MVLLCITVIRVRSQDVVQTHKCLPSAKRFGKALPVDKFTGEDSELRFEDWLPACHPLEQLEPWRAANAISRSLAWTRMVSAWAGGKSNIQWCCKSGTGSSGADVTIMGVSLFQKVVAANRSRNTISKVPRTYAQKTFVLHGYLNLDIAGTRVYIKMDAHDELLLSEGVCRKLGIISYHPDVKVKGGLQLSPLVHSKDGSLRVCIDYCELNSVTKAKTFPLPKFRKLLGKAKHFSTLDLASGFWQIRMHL